MWLNEQNADFTWVVSGLLKVTTVVLNDQLCLNKHYPYMEIRLGRINDSYKDRHSSRIFTGKNMHSLTV